MWQAQGYRYVKYSGLQRGDRILVAKTAVLFSHRALNRKPAADVQTSHCLAAGLPFQGLLGVVYFLSQIEHMASLGSVEDTRTVGDPMEEEERENKAPREEPMVKKMEGSAAVDEKLTEMTRYCVFYTDVLSSNRS